MLKSLDVLIGLVVILLALSMAVTVITQSLTTLFNTRGKHLRRGLIDLLDQIDPALAASGVSASVATALLEHPLVSGSSMPFGEGRGWRRLVGGARLGNVIHREEFTKMLMGMASGGAATLPGTAATALKSALAKNGVSDPDATLKAIRTIALQLEKSSPELSNAARQTAAVLHAAQTDLVAKINTWFDQTMDRTAQRFTASTRVLTFLGAFVVAFGLQVDTPLLYNRLQADDVLRERLVREAQSLPAADSEPGAGFDTKYRDFLSEAGIITLPSVADWGQCFDAGTANTPCFEGRSIAGMLVTALLLSLGAPFWYNALRNLLQLRSLLAAKDDAQRKERQSQTPPADGTIPPAASSGAGERGDLAAIG